MADIVAKTQVRAIRSAAGTPRTRDDTTNAIVPFSHPRTRMTSFG
jgi:hypothetical protein